MPNPPLDNPWSFDDDPPSHEEGWLQPWEDGAPEWSTEMEELCGPEYWLDKEDEDDETLG